MMCYIDNMMKMIMMIQVMNAQGEEMTISLVILVMALRSFSDPYRLHSHYWMDIVRISMHLAK